MTASVSAAMPHCPFFFSAGPAVLQLLFLLLLPQCSCTAGVHAAEACQDDRCMHRHTTGMPPLPLPTPLASPLVSLQTRRCYWPRSVTACSKTLGTMAWAARWPRCRVRAVGGGWAALTRHAQRWLH